MKTNDLSYYDKKRTGNVKIALGLGLFVLSVGLLPILLKWMRGGF